MESHGYVSIEAEHYSRKKDQGGAGCAGIFGNGFDAGRFVLAVERPDLPAGGVSRNTCPG